MRYTWTFDRSATADRYRLILVDADMRARWVPGYDSRNAQDVIEAFMYLNTGYHGKRLTDRHIKLLDEIKLDAALQFDID